MKKCDVCRGFVTLVLFSFLPSVVCHAELGSSFNISAMKELIRKEEDDSGEQSEDHSKSSEEDNDNSEEREEQTEDDYKSSVEDEDNSEDEGHAIQPPIRDQ